MGLLESENTSYREYISPPSIDTLISSTASPLNILLSLYSITTPPSVNGELCHLAKTLGCATYLNNGQITAKQTRKIIPSTSAPIGPISLPGVKAAQTLLTIKLTMKPLPIAIDAGLNAGCGALCLNIIFLYKWK